MDQINMENIIDEDDIVSISDSEISDDLRPEVRLFLKGNFHILELAGYYPIL